MSDQSAPPSGEPTTDTPTGVDAPQGQQETQSDPYRERLEQRLEEMAQHNRSLAENFQAFQQQFEQQYEDDDNEPYALEPGEEGYDEQEAQRALDEYIERQLEAKLQPLHQQQAVQQRDSAYDSFVQQYPQMQDEKFATSIVQQAAAAADEMGLPLEDPRFVRLIELTYKAHVADQRAAGETPAGQRTEVQLESGGGAAPQDREEDIEARVIAAGKRFGGI